MTKTHIFYIKFVAEILLNDQNVNLNSGNHFLKKISKISAQK
jgi:hypothetical protein